MLNQELTEQLRKLIIRKFKKRKVHSPFIDNIWGVWYCRYAINKEI